MEIKFTLRDQYEGSQYIAGPFKLSGTTNTNETYELATNVPKSSLLTGHTVTTTYNITGGTIGSLGVCFNTQNYVLTFSQGPIVVGNFTAYSGFSKTGIVKMNNSGTTDNTFNVGTGFNILNTGPQYYGLGNGGPTSIARQNDGKIIVGGKFSTYRDDNYPGLIRLNPDGSPDYTFAVPSLFSLTTILDVAYLSDGKILVGGCVGLNPVGDRYGMLTGTTTGMLYRLNNDGSIDNTFLANGVLGGTNLNGAVKVILPLPNNDILIAGGFADLNTSPSPLVRGLMKLTSEGTRDITFQGSVTGAVTNTANIGHVECMTLDSEGRIMIGGTFNLYDQNSLVGQAIRINTTGARDTSWNPIPSNGINITGMVTSIVEDSSGNDYIAGYFNTNISGVAKSGIMKFTPLGTLDLNFSGQGFTYGNVLTSNGYVWFPGPKLGILSDNNLLATGPFTTYTAVNTLGFAKISPTTGNLISSDFTNSGQYYTGVNYNSLVCI